MTTTTLAFPNIGPMEITVILVIGLLLFGRRLPEVGRNVGKAIVEFKKGLKDMNEDVRTQIAEADRESEKRSQRERADDDDRASRSMPSPMPVDDRAVGREGLGATPGTGGAHA